MEGIVRCRLVFSPHAHRGGVVMNHGTIDAEAAECLYAHLGEDFPRPVLVDAVEHPSDGVVVEHLRGDIRTQKERNVPGAEELLHPVKGRSPRENIHDKPEKDRPWTHFHAAGERLIHDLHEIHTGRVLLHDRQMRRGETGLHVHRPLSPKVLGLVRTKATPSSPSL